jgi:hypothetical protein
MRIAFDPILAARAAALILYYRAWGVPEPLDAQAVIGWPEHRPPSLASSFTDHA